MPDKGGVAIFSSLYKKYWQIGFTTRLYEWLCPEAYLDSLRRVAESIPRDEEGLILDAGCGSGMLLPFLADRLGSGTRYLGLDILPAGLASLEEKARQLGVSQSVATLQGDLSRPLSMKDHTVNYAAAHFSIYTLPAEHERQRVFRELFRVVTPGGLLVTANPTSGYDAEAIIRQSVESLREKMSSRRLWATKNLLYPLTLRLGLKHIERQISAGTWHGYALDELNSDIESAGFSIDHTEAVYAGSGVLVVARKP